MRSSSTLALACLGSLIVLGCAESPHSVANWKGPVPGTGPAGSPVTVHGQLKVVGTQLQDASGAPAQLKGVSSQWLQWETAPYPESKEALRNMRDGWKLSLIRAAMGTEQASGYLTDPTAKAAIQTKVEMIVQNAIDLGVYVIVDWHTEKAVDQQAGAIAFFTEMAQKYGEYPNVIWEPYNEPRGYTWAQIKAYHEAVVAAIRAKDPDNLIVLGTPNYSQDVDVAAADQVAGTNLLYTLHWYACTHKQSLRDKGDAALAAGAPLFVTEFGATYADGGRVGSQPANGDPGNVVCRTEAESWFAWMAANNVSGAAWKLDICTDASCILKGSASTSGPWTTADLSTDVGGKAGPSGTAGGHGVLIADWIQR